MIRRTYQEKINLHHLRSKGLIFLTVGIMSGQECPICSLKFSSSTQLRQHIVQNHPAAKPYKCTICSSSFKLHGSLNRHQKECESSWQRQIHPAPSPSKHTTKRKSLSSTEKRSSHDEPPAKRTASSTDSLAQPAIEQGNLTLDDVSNLQEYLCGTSESLQKWFDKYLHHNFHVKAPLSEETLHQVEVFLPRFSQALDTHLQEVITFEDALDNFIDQLQEQVQPQTLANYLRYVRWIVLWKVSNKLCPFDLVGIVESHIQKFQAFASQRNHHVQLLNFLSPLDLLNLRETVVGALRREQVFNIDPVILQYLKHNALKGVALHQFAIRMRNWLELCFRFVDVPMRIQCSTDLLHYEHKQAASSDYTYTAKLDKLPSGYVRIICRDKVQQAHQPVHLNVPQTLNAYLHFYLTNCLPALTTRPFLHVFPNANGQKWTKASKQLKLYMRDVLGVDPDTIEPTGRFIHCSRKIALAAFATSVGFNVDKMRGFAKLMRHSLATSEQFYCHWADTYLAQQAVINWHGCMYNYSDGDRSNPHSAPGDLPGALPAFRPSGLRSPPDTLQKWFLSSFVFCEQDFVYQRQDVACQTDDSELSTVQTVDLQSNFSHSEKRVHANTLDSQSTLPKCRGCGNTFSVLGPYGLQKDALRFGCYFSQCVNCTGKRPNKHTFWFKPGHVPSEKSVSSKPRTRKYMAIQASSTGFSKLDPAATTVKVTTTS